MSIKERPLIKAVEKLGPLPGFLFENPIVAGFFAMFMCPVFGGVFTLFWTLNGKTLEIFDAVHAGAYIAMLLGVFIFTGIYVSSFSEPEEKEYRQQFVFGGAICVVFLMTLDFFTYDFLRGSIGEGSYLVCTGVSYDCP